MNMKRFMLLMSCLASGADSLAITYTVTTTADDGKGSLRAAINKINTCNEPSCILFDIPTTDKGYNKDTQSWCIAVASELPKITAQVNIDGYSQKGSYPNCNPINKGHTAHIAIELCGPGAGDPSSAPTGMKGLAFGPGSDYSCVSGLAVQDFPVGIDVSASHVKVAGNFLGVGVDGETPRHNIVSVMVNQNASNTQIGTGQPSDRNLIAGTGSVPTTTPMTSANTLGAVTVAGPNTSIQGSTVNLTSSGQTAVPAPSAVAVAVAPTTGTTIGGTTASQTVVAAAATTINVAVFASAPSTTPTTATLSNVLVGTNVSGTIPLASSGSSSALSAIFDAGAITNSALDEVSQQNSIVVSSSLFSGTEHGIVIGHPDDLQPVSGVTLTHVKVGTDRLGTSPIPNSGHGIWLRNATNTQLEHVQTKYNGKCGLRQEEGVTNTTVTGIDTSFNGEGGVKLMGPDRSADAFEGTLTKTRVTGNGNNAISSANGYLKEMPKLS